MPFKQVYLQNLATSYNGIWGLLKISIQPISFPLNGQKIMVKHSLIFNLRDATSTSATYGWITCIGPLWA